MLFGSGMEKNKKIGVSEIGGLGNVWVGRVERVIDKGGGVWEENMGGVKEMMEEVGYRGKVIGGWLGVKKGWDLVGVIGDFGGGD